MPRLQLRMFRLLLGCEAGHSALEGHSDTQSVASLQDVKLTPWQDFMPLQEWNKLNRQPMWSWLEEERHHSASARMKQCGNVVVPEQATRAFQILLHLQS